jgi:hypothetical protein
MHLPLPAPTPAPSTRLDEEGRRVIDDPVMVEIPPIIEFRKERFGYNGHYWFEWQLEVVV